MAICALAPGEADAGLFDCIRGPKIRMKCPEKETETMAELVDHCWQCDDCDEYDKYYPRDPDTGEKLEFGECECYAAELFEHIKGRPNAALLLIPG